MRGFVKSISDRTEFVFVFILAFGYSIYISVLSVVSPGSYQTLTDIDFYLLLAEELVIMSILLPFLAVRGWDLQRIGLSISIKESLIGVALTIASYAAYVFFLAIVWEIFSRPEATASANGFEDLKLSFLTIIVVSIVNPIFEELFVCGYVMTSLKKRTNIWVAINASILIRLLYHLYQGPIGVISIIPIGIIFAYWYARTGRLWPLIVAHSLLDLFGLLSYSDL